MRTCVQLSGTRYRRRVEGFQMSRRVNVELLRNVHCQLFSELYPITSNAALMERFGVSRGTIQRLAQQLSLKRDSRYHTEVQRHNAAGRVVTQAAREKMRQKALGRKMSNETKKKILET